MSSRPLSHDLPGDPNKECELLKSEKNGSRIRKEGRIFIKTEKENGKERKRRKRREVIIVWPEHMYRFLKDWPMP